MQKTSFFGKRDLLPVLAVPLFTVFFMASPCFGLLSLGYVSKERAQEMGLEIRSRAAGPNAVWVEMTFKPVGRLKGFRQPANYNRIELRLSEKEGENSRPLLTAALREDRSQSGRITVSLMVDRSQLERASLWVVQAIEGSANVIRLREFVDLEALDAKEEEGAASGATEKTGVALPAAPASPSGGGRK